MCFFILSKLIHYSFNSLLFLKLIDYSKVFPLYQRLNPLFDWIFNRLLSDRSILARGVPPSLAGPRPLDFIFYVYSLTVSLALKGSSRLN